MRISGAARVFLVITLGVLASFLLLWLAALLQPGTTLYFGRQVAPRWAWYLDIVEWYGVMAYVLGAIWVFTQDSPVKANGKPARFGSVRLNRILLASLPFFGLGTVFGKTFDALELVVGRLSMSLAVLVLVALVVEDLRIWYRTRPQSWCGGSLRSSALGANRTVKSELKCVQQVLRDWDPIGVQPGMNRESAPLDEYDAYAPEILSRLRGGASSEEILGLLTEIRVKSLELPACPEKDRAISAKLVAWWKNGQL